MITHYWVLSIVYMKYPGWMRHFSFQFKAFICHSLVLKLTSEKIILILLRKYNKHIYVCVCIGSLLHQSYFVFGHLKCNRSPSHYLGRWCALIIAVTLSMEFSSVLAFTVSKRAPQPSSRVCRGRFPGVLWHSDICKVQPSLALLIFPSVSTYSGKSWWPCISRVPCRNVSSI